MRVNLSISEGEQADLLKVIEYQKRVMPGSDPTIPAVAKVCLNSGLQLLLAKANTVDQVESVKTMKGRKK